MRDRFLTGMSRCRYLVVTLVAALRRPAHDGQTMVLFALMAVVLIGFLGLAIDAGYLISERRRAQNAADAVALAAAKLRAQGKSQADATTGALAVVAPSGEYPDGFPSTEITVTYPAPNRVIATVEHDVQPFFIRALYTGDWVVSAEAVASLTTDTGPFALLALAQGNNCNTPNTGIRFQGSGTVVINNGSIGSNNCIHVSGATNLTVEVHGGTAQAVNEIVYNGNAEIQVDDDYYVSGGIPLIPDPLAGLTPPACSTAGTVLPDPSHPEDPEGKNYVILTPGRYADSKGYAYKGISLLPGVYCFEARVTVRDGFIRTVDAGYASGGAAGDLPAGGVVLYFSGNRGQLKLDGGAVAQLRAAGAASSLSCNALPGTNSGLCDEKILIWIANSQPLTLNGHVENELIGTIYAPNASVTLAGTEDTPVLNGRVIARDITITGDALLNLDADPEGTADPTRVYLIK